MFQSGTSFLFLLQHIITSKKPMSLKTSKYKFIYVTYMQQELCILTKCRSVFNKVWFQYMLCSNFYFRSQKAWQEKYKALRSLEIRVAFFRHVPSESMVGRHRIRLCPRATCHSCNKSNAHKKPTNSSCILHCSVDLIFFLN